MATIRLTARQMKYAKLVADGMEEVEAVKEAGYSLKGLYTTRQSLKDNERVNNQIKFYREDRDKEDSNVIADSAERQRLWTSIMNDPSYTGNVRLEASKLLGKAQGDFTVSKKIEHSTGKRPVVLIPKSSPEDWEKYWENKND